MFVEDFNDQKGYRTRLEIIKDILAVAHEAGSLGSKKTRIMYGANLSFKLLTKYLEVVVESNLMCCGDHTHYTITNKGRKFLEVYSEYEKEAKEIEKHDNKRNTGKNELEKMLALSS
jgi:predicted transcriptional regulator